MQLYVCPEQYINIGANRLLTNYKSSTDSFQSVNPEHVHTTLYIMYTLSHSSSLKLRVHIIHKPRFSYRALVTEILCKGCSILSLSRWWTNNG